MQIARKIAFYLYLFVFWVLFFVTIKIIFLLFHFRLSFSLPFSDWFRIIDHGLKMDLSAAGYLMVIPSLFFIIFGKTGHKTITLFCAIYTLLLLFCLSLLAVIDMDIYKYWGFHLDTTPLTYITSVKESFASVSAWEIFLLLFLALLIFAGFCWLYFKFISLIFEKFEPTAWVPSSLVFLFITPFLMIPIRGGFGIAPMNSGQVYFHTNQYANHAAVNFFWNLGNSLINLESLDNPYKTLSTSEAESIVHSLYKSNCPAKSILNTNKPNVLLIILESFTAKVIKPLGGIDSITPCFNSLTREGILFSNLYASGDRSDKAMVSVFGGFPAQPQKSIIIYPSKTMHLPGLGLSLKNIGYDLCFYYGGNIDFASMRSYFNMNGFDRMITQDSFPESARNSKWGVYDHIVFEKLVSDLSNAKQPFFYSFFTLTSHEPFEIPVKPFFNGNDDDTKFYNAIRYTDSALGSFINQAKKSSWWKNTLIILIADHGSYLPGATAHYLPKKYHIPMLWLGGALSIKDSIMHNTCSQTDLAATLLSQMGMDHDSFTYSRNALCKSNNHFAYYSFNNGFGFITDSSKAVFDFNSRQNLLQEGNGTDSIIKTGKAYLQVLYDDFLKK